MFVCVLLVSLAAILFFSSRNATSQQTFSVLLYM